MNTDPGLSVHATIAIGPRVLMRDLFIHISPGRILTLTGESGAGKSSLIAFVCGALDPAFKVQGQAHLNGRRLDVLPIEQRRVGVLYQDDLLFGHLSVAENLAFAVPQGVARSERRRRVEVALDEAELSGFGPRDPATLSGGQKARVALMRALLAEPEALLLDEAFSKLDPELRNRVRDFTFATIRKRGLPTLLVTHDADDAGSGAGDDRLHLDGQGGVARMPQTTS